VERRLRQGALVGREGEDERRADGVCDSKDADKLIMKHLKTEGKLIAASTIQHSYPFCWR
jgi:isoleucyl-tRNA synthetase